MVHWNVEEDALRAMVVIVGSQVGNSLYVPMMPAPSEFDEEGLTGGRMYERESASATFEEYFKGYR